MAGCLPFWQCPDLLLRRPKAQIGGAAVRRTDLRRSSSQEGPAEEVGVGLAAHARPHTTIPPSEAIGPFWLKSLLVAGLEDTKLRFPARGCWDWIPVAPGPRAAALLPACPGPPRPAAGHRTTPDRLQPGDSTIAPGLQGGLPRGTRRRAARCPADGPWPPSESGPVTKLPRRSSAVNSLDRSARRAKNNGSLWGR